MCKSQVCAREHKATARAPLPDCCPHIETPGCQTQAHGRAECWKKLYLSDIHPDGALMRLCRPRPTGEPGAHCRRQLSLLSTDGGTHGSRDRKRAASFPRTRTGLTKGCHKFTGKTALVDSLPQPTGLTPQ